MGFIIVGIIFLVLGIVFMLAFKISRNSEIQFEKNAYYTEGVIVGRKMKSDGYMDEEYVRVIDRYGNEKKLLSQSFRPINPTIEPGTIVKVALAEKKTLGISTYELRIVDERYAKQSNGRVSNTLFVLTFMFIVIAIIMFVLRFI